MIPVPGHPVSVFMDTFDYLAMLILDCSVFSNLIKKYPAFILVMHDMNDQLSLLVHFVDYPHKFLGQGRLTPLLGSTNPAISMCTKVALKPSIGGGDPHPGHTTLRGV